MSDWQARIDDAESEREVVAIARDYTGKITREIACDGNVVVTDAKCKIVFRRIRPGVLEIQIAGIDDGQFGTALIDEVLVALVREGPLELFIDASDASMPAVSVAKGWTNFFAFNRKSLKRVRILVGSKAVALTMEIVRYLSDTGDLIRIYSDRELYDAQGRAEVVSFGKA